MLQATAVMDPGEQMKPSKRASINKLTRQRKQLQPDATWI